MKQKIDHYGEKEMAALSPTDRGNKRRRRRNIVKANSTKSLGIFYHFIPPLIPAIKRIFMQKKIFFYAFSFFI